MKNWYSAGIITYIMENNEPLYLILHYTAGHWEFPKGTMDPGESKTETAHRELKEETGLTAVLDDNFEESIEYIYTDYNKEKWHKTVYFFIGKATNKAVQLSHEHIGFKWLPYEQALEQLTYENGKILLKKAHAHILSTIKE